MLRLLSRSLRWRSLDVALARAAIRLRDQRFRRSVAAFLAIASSLGQAACPAPPSATLDSPASPVSQPNSPSASAPPWSGSPAHSAPSAAAAGASPTAAPLATASASAEPSALATSVAPSSLSRSPAVRPFTTWEAGDVPPAERESRAISARAGVVRELFEAAGVAFPPAVLLFRAFKRDRELEVWAASTKDAPLKHVTTYGICRISGDVGPKRREGDFQVPEGFYTIHYLWPISNYHLEMKVGYPNASDRILGAKEPGGDIMIHGSCASIGCLSMSDERIEELWTMALPVTKAGAKVNVYIFPARAMAELLADKAQAQNWAFWSNLKEGLDAFEQTHKLPSVGVDWRGRYTFK